MQNVSAAKKIIENAPTFTVNQTDAERESCLCCTISRHLDLPAWFLSKKTKNTYIPIIKAKSAYLNKAMPIAEGA